jgi:glycosyltransferase involved in cell wall biosynthesis
MISAVIDSQVFAMQRRGGISRYFVELLKNSDAFERREISLRTPYRRVLNVQAAAELPDRFQMLPNNGFKMGRMLMAARAAQSRIIARGDLVHHTYYDRRFLSAKKHGARVCTIYDMIPEKFPELFPGGNPHNGKQTFVDQSDGIIAISHQTKSDLIEVYGTPESRITVISLGVSDYFSPAEPGPSGEGSVRPYILFVGRRGGYKNFRILLDALTRRPEFADLTLIAAGGGAFSAVEQSLIHSLGLTDRIQQRDASEETLVDLYRHAAAMVFPSKYEGFGLPVLEAMASGCPAILANAGSLPEVGGEAALYFDPLSRDDLISRLSVLIHDTTKRSNLREAGLRRAKEFSWKMTAQKTAALYATM